MSPPMPRVGPLHDESEPLETGNLWRFLKFTSPYKKWLIFGVVAGLVRVILPLYVPWFIGRIIDTIAVPEELTSAERWERLWRMLPQFLAILGLHLLATIGRFYFPQIAATQAIRDIRSNLFRHLQRLSLGFHTQRPSGTIVGRVMNDVTSAQRIFDVLLVQASQVTMQAAVIAAVMLVTDWQWGLVAFVTLPVFYFSNRMLRGPMREASRKVLERVEEIAGHMQERMSMIREVQAFTAEKREEDHVHGQVERLKGHMLKQHKLRGLLVAAADISRFGGVVIVACFGAWRVAGGHATPGDITTFVMYTGMLLNPLQFFSNFYPTLHVAAAAADRVFEFLDTEPAIVDSPDAQPLKSRRPPAVSFENVTFSYPTDDPVVVLKDISFSVEPGWRVVLVGESGSGKSTLMSLLPRFYDMQQGRIAIDGQDIRDVRVKSLRQAIGIVPQEAILFTGAIRSNIRYGNREATEAEVIEAARAANADAFIQALPEGYDTIVGERGVGLSGGQVQRVAIARAFLKDPAILILDEATSNLDATSEELVLEALERLSRGRTNFTIAHRLSVARGADLIVVLSEGRIVETGNHDDLLKRDGAYAELWRKQMEGGL